MIGFYIAFLSLILLIIYLIHKGIKSSREYNKWLANATPEERNKAFQEQMLLLGTIFVLNNISKK